MKIYKGLILMTFVASVFNSPLFSWETQFYIVRHGQTDWNVEQRVQGQTDIPLNQTGRDEAISLGLMLKNVTFAEGYSSDLQRAHDTALIVTEKHMPPLTINKDTRLRERDAGSWEGRLMSDYYNFSLEDITDVESLQDVQKRAFDFLHEIVKNQQDGNNVLVVSHGGVIKNMIVKFLDLQDRYSEIKIKNTAYLIVTFTKQEGWKIKELNGIELPSCVEISL